MRSQAKEAGNANPHAVGEDIHERCSLYLLGEMDDGQAAVFEAELRDSDPLQSELISQSEIVVGLSRVKPSVCVAPAGSSHSSLRVVITAVAIATCVMIAFLSRPTEQVRDKTVVAESMPESLLIAHAWAEGSVAATDISDLNGNSEPDFDAELGEPFTVDDQPWEDESTLSWIVTAVEAGAISDG